MNIGSVTSDGDALVRVAVEGPGERIRDVEAVLDTGFNGFLALPAGDIEALDLVYQNELQLTLASGEEHSAPTYRAAIRWNGVARSVAVVEAGEALAGMALFWGYALHIECRSAGRVEVEGV